MVRRGNVGPKALERTANNALSCTRRPWYRRGRHLQHSSFYGFVPCKLKNKGRRKKNCKGGSTHAHAIAVVSVLKYHVFIFFERGENFGRRNSGTPIAATV